MTQQERKTIATQQAPGAIGPYSQAVQYGNLLFTSGQLGMDAWGACFPPGEKEAATCKIIMSSCLYWSRACFLVIF
ncbi:Rid family hydrolase [Paenibacillus sp. NPDC058910]|uniref:Rid family hydrolase n=1 Tax=Paenibacillus sp. NPDC058910 TaxID=3346670 RepID=UPI0036B40BFC